MSILIGSSTSALATSNSNQRKIVKTSTGTLVLFANLGNNSGNRIKYKVSTDKGDTWGDWISVYNDADITNFDVCIDGSNNILIAIVRVPNNYQDFIKLSYTGSNTWSNGSAVNFNLGYSSSISIVLRSNGEIWFAVDKSNNSTAITARYSSDGGTSWTAKNTTMGFNTRTVVLLADGFNILLICHNGAAISSRLYTTSWQSESSIVGSGITAGANSIAALYKDSSNIWVAGRTSSGIKVFYYSGSWDAGTLISNSANDESPALSLITNKPVLVWRDYDGSNYNIYYSKFNGTSWDTEVAVTSDVAVDSHPASNVINTTDLYIIWTTGSSSPYSIYFYKVKTFVATYTEDIDSDSTVYDNFHSDINSNSTVKATGLTSDINSDSRVYIVNQLNAVLGWRTAPALVFCPDLINFSFIFPVIYVSEENPKLSIGNSKLPVLVSGCLFGYSVYLENTGTSGNTEIELYVNSALKSNLTIPADGNEYKKNIYFPMDFLFYPEDYIEVKVISFATGAENLRVNVNEMSFNSKVEKTFIGNYSDSIIFQGINREYIFTKADYWYLDFNQPIDIVNYLIGIDNNGDEINLSYTIENGIFYHNRIKISKYSTSLLEKIKIKVKDILGEYHCFEFPIIMRTSYSAFPGCFYGSILIADTFIPATDSRYSFDGGSTWSPWGSIVAGKVEIDFSGQIQGVKNIKVQYKKNFENIEEDIEILYADSEIDCNVYFRGKTAQVVYTDEIPMQRVDVYYDNVLSGTFSPFIKTGIDSVSFDSEAETITINSGSIYYTGGKYDFAGQVYTVDKNKFLEDFVIIKQCIFGFNKKTMQFEFIEIPDDYSNKLSQNYPQLLCLVQVFYKICAEYDVEAETWSLSIFFSHSEIKEISSTVDIALDYTKNVMVRVIDIAGRVRDFTQEFIQLKHNKWKTLVVSNGATVIKPGQIHSFTSLNYAVTTEED